MKLSLEYAAGFFDGEGYVAITRSAQTKQPASIRVTVTQKRYLILESFVETFGGVIYDSYDSRTDRSWGQWVLHGDEALKFLKLIYPYLICKQDQANVAIEYQDNIHHTPGTYMNPVESERRYSLFTKLKGLRS